MGNDKIRICYTLNSFEIGGAETVALDLARSHDPELFEVEVVAMLEPSTSGESEMRNRFINAGVKTSIIQQKKYRSPLALWRIYRYLKKGNFDIVHGHNRGADYWGAKLSSWAGIPYYFWTRHLVYQDLSEKQIRRYSTLSKNAFKVIAVSETVRTACIETEEISEQHVKTVVNGIDTGKFAPLSVHVRAEKRVELDLGPDEHFLLFVGRFSNQKAPEAFISLIWELREMGLPVRGFMCGYGPLAADLKKMVEDGPPGVEILGLRSDIPVLLGACDLFVSTSRNEGLPLNVMEAMSAGAPFVAPGIPQIKELVTGSSELENSLYSSPPMDGPVEKDQITEWARKVAEVLQDDTTLATSGKVGRKVIQEKFSLLQMVTRYEELFLEASGHLVTK